MKRKYGRKPLLVVNAVAQEMGRDKYNAITRKRLDAYRRIMEERTAPGRPPRLIWAENWPVSWACCSACNYKLDAYEKTQSEFFSDLKSNEVSCCPRCGARWENVK